MTLTKCLLALLCSFTLSSAYAQTPTVGLLQNDSTSFNGYTLLAPTASQTTYLIDNCGFVVHTWPSNYFPGQAVYLLDNGQLLRTARVNSSVFNGGGIGGRVELIDWDGTLAWSYDYASTTVHQHHDVEYLPSGNILILAWEYKTAAEAISQGRNASTVNGQLWPEHIIEVEPVGTSGGNIVWQWHVWDHLVQDYDNTKPNYGVVADQPELIDLNYTGGGGPGGAAADWMHGNSVDYNPKLDQIIINSRSFNEFWIIDHSTTTVEAASHTGGDYGMGGDLIYRWGNQTVYDAGGTIDQMLFGAHDSHWITEGPDSGKIMIFNNGDGRPAGNYSTIEMIVPPVDSTGKYYVESNGAYGPTSVYWNYTASPATSFYSQNVSGAQQQPNGNVLICEGASGRLFEVDLNGNTVWEYLNPMQNGNPVNQGSNPGGNQVFRAYRYAPNFAGLAGKDLTPGAVIELNPYASTCVIYVDTMETDTIIGINAALANATINFMPNPVNNELILSNTSGQNGSLYIYNLHGQLVYQANFLTGNTLIQTEDWATGIYIGKIILPEFNDLITTKIIKQ